MHSAVLIPAPAVPRRTLLWVALALLAGIALFVMAQSVQAVDFTALTGSGSTSVLKDAILKLQDLGPGVKAIVIFLGFIVALITLIALRNFGSVIFYVGMAVFAAVGLPIAAAIAGAVI